ncbi:hypothetical protein FACS1894193_08370 [Bacilli bacterium]|nr:hypothetical protein FACS1894193_08370 [Bacilli bacterium]
MTLTNGGNWTLEDYEGKLGEFEFSSQIEPVRTRGLPTSWYFTSSWSGCGNGMPSLVYIDKTLLFYYGGHVPRVAASPA